MLHSTHPTKQTDSAAPATQVPCLVGAAHSTGVATGGAL